MISEKYDTASAGPDTRDEGYESSHTRSSRMEDVHAILSDAAGFVGELLSLGSLRLQMMQAEIRTGTTAWTRSLVICALAVAIGVLGVGALTLALICGLAAMLPFSLPIAVACGALVVALLYGTIAWIAMNVATRSMKTVRMAPRETMREMKRDFETLFTVRQK